MATVCANCKSPASLTCDGCRECPTSSFDTDITTAYCDRECQAAHAKAHEAECNGARLRRGLRMICASIANGLREYRKRTFEFPLENVELANNQLKLTVPLYGAVAPMYAGGRSYALPDPLWDTLTLETQKIVLLRNTCEDVTILASKPLAFMLRGIASEVMALVVDHKGPPITPHVAIRCVLTNDEVFVLDFSGAQFGCFDVVCPFDLYVSRHCVGSRLARQPLSEFRKIYHDKYMGESGDERAGQVYSRMILDTIDKCMVPMYSRRGLDSSALVQRNDASELAMWLGEWERWFEREVAEVVAALDGRWDGILERVPSDQELDDIIEKHMDWTAHSQRVNSALNRFPGGATQEQDLQRRSSGVDLTGVQSHSS